VKHVYEEHVVVQFDCTNTIKEQVLEGVTVVMDLADAVRRAGGWGVCVCGWSGVGNVPMLCWACGS
jgi:hypothetical protein